MRYVKVSALLLEDGDIVYACPQDKKLHRFKSGRAVFDVYEHCFKAASTMSEPYKDMGVVNASPVDLKITL
jgi:hypothetical protein